MEALQTYRMVAMRGEDRTIVMNRCGMLAIMGSRLREVQAPSHAEKMGNGMLEDHQLHVYKVLQVFFFCNLTVTVAANHENDTCFENGLVSQTA